MRERIVIVNRAAILRVQRTGNYIEKKHRFMAVYLALREKARIEYYHYVATWTLNIYRRCSAARLALSKERRVYLTG